MTFTHTIDALTFKNPVHRDGSWLYMSVKNCNSPTPSLREYGTSVVRFNWSDAPLLHSHRWRLTNDGIVTTLPNASGTEEVWRVENHLFRKGRHVVIPHTDKDPLNCVRANLEAVRKAPTVVPNTITTKGDDAFIHLPGAGNRVAVIDRSQVPKVEAYRWVVTTVENRDGTVTHRVQTTVRDPETGAKTTMQLATHLTRTNPNDRLRVTFLDGDRMNHRLNNLQPEIRIRRDTE